MDSAVRIFIKSVTWQLAGFLSMMMIGFFFTGSFVASGGIAIAASVTGFLCYFVHEFLWSKVEWGRG